MDGATIQAKVYYGYAQAAKRVGRPFVQFRAVSGVTTLASPSIAVINAAMTVASASGFNFQRPPLETDVLFSALVDGSLVQVGDILRDANGVSFVVGSMAHLAPPVTIRANAVVRIFRRSVASLAAGLNAYQGPTLVNETATLANLPANIELTSAGKASRSTTLPSDAPGPLKYTLHLSPQVDTTMVAIDDAVIDDAGRRFMISGFERTPSTLRLDTVHIRA